jgi:hypothetical protein
MANIGHAVDASILRLILIELGKKKIKAVPLHDSVKVCVLDVPAAKVCIKSVYNKLFQDSELLVSNLFLNPQNKKIMSCEDYTSLSIIVKRFLKKQVETRKLLDKAEKSLDMFQ